MDSEGEKLDDLSTRINKAERGADKAAKPDDSAPAAAGSRVGMDFVGAIVGSGILGAIMDHAFGTAPWCLVGMIVVGFGLGIMSAWRAMQSK